MTLPSNDEYVKIGEAVVDAMTREWQSIHLTVDVPDDGVMSVDGLYIDKNGTEQKFIVPDIALKELFQIYTQMSKSPKGKWNKMIFKLKPAGQLEVFFDY